MVKNDHMPRVNQRWISGTPIEGWAARVAGGLRLPDQAIWFKGCVKTSDSLRRSSPWAEQRPEPNT